MSNPDDPLLVPTTELFDYMRRGYVENGPAVIVGDDLCYPMVKSEELPDED